MATNGELTRKELAFSAAALRFPRAELAIRRLMNRNEDFCNLCADLADAERALASVPTAPPALCEERKLEWREMIETLVCEIGEVLRESEGWSPGSNS
ncbi:hypothetical protein [Rhizobium leguminosarum]|uniref:Uncharacterized protein n=1 Tax=Rhizobium leguminosarum TaxID=384 RepID=A0A2K9Z348_RHILE|nr:hypothetical protein [Rhizobium leguminosarum]AUW42667.1 hypothetical protein CUJ84_Chr002309 [Rhizobium leguminosarum]